MKLSKDELQELNQLLKSKDLDLPSFKRSVCRSGGNLRWLQRNITIRNPDANPRVLELLGAKKPKTIEVKNEQEVS